MKGKMVFLKVRDIFVSFFKSILTYSKTNVLFFTFVFTSLINACILRVITVGSVFDISPLLADLAVILLFGSLGYLLKPNHQFRYFFVLSVIFSLLCMINSVYYNNFLSFVSVSLIKTATQLAEVSDAVTQNVIETKDFVYLFQIVALLFVHRYLKRKEYYKKVSEIEVGKDRLLNTVVAGLIVLGFFISTLTSTDISRLSKQWNRNLIMQKFGLYTYQLNDIFATLKSTINPLFGYDNAAKSFREYYSVEKEHKKNKYTNMFKGKNVIAIHAESIQNYLLDLSFNGEYVTPNLRKLKEEGLYFSNFYAQESIGTSSDTEFTYATSLLPTSSGTVFMNYFDRDYVSIQKKLKEEGYYVFSMHGNNCSYWNRKTMHQSLGYDKFYCYPSTYTLDETVGLGLSDVSFFRQSTQIIKQIKQEHSKFYGTMIMLSNHTPFNDKGTAYSDFDVSYHYKNEQGEEVSAPYMEGTKLGYYIKSAHYADMALGLFIDELEQEGLLENTVLIIYGDHDSKLKKSEYTRLYNYDFKTNTVKDSESEDFIDVDYYQYELNRKVPLIIWSKDKKLKKEVDTVMGMIDVFPTIGNMLGVSNKYALGNDIFNVKDNIVVFPDGNWLTNKMYYSRSKDEGMLLDTSYTVSAEYINENNEYADTLINISDSIIVHDLIKEEGDKLEE